MSDNITLIENKIDEAGTNLTKRLKSNQAANSFLQTFINKAQQIVLRKQKEQENSSRSNQAMHAFGNSVEGL